MKVSIMKRVDVSFDAIRVVAALRYAEEDAPGGMFGLDGESLSLCIDLSEDGSTAKIRGWQGKPIHLHSKVCDCCSVYLLNGNEIVGSRENNYVPSFMPGQHYGDYLILDIEADGTISNWRKPVMKSFEFLGEE